MQVDNQRLATKQSLRHRNDSAATAKTTDGFVVYVTVPGVVTHKVRKKILSIIHATDDGRKI